MRDVHEAATGVLRRIVRNSAVDLVDVTADETSETLACWLTFEGQSIPLDRFERYVVANLMADDG